MSTIAPGIALKLVSPGTAGHVNANEATSDVSVLLAGTVIDRDLSAPPSTPATGDAYLVGPTATGAWEDHEDDVAYYAGTSGWRFVVPKQGTRMWVADEASAVVYTLGGWVTDAGMPVGSFMLWPTGTPPSGWLAADGTAVSRTTYARLFAVVGTEFGAGNGTTTFNLPDPDAVVCTAGDAIWIVKY